MPTTTSQPSIERLRRIFGPALQIIRYIGAGSYKFVYEAQRDAEHLALVVLRDDSVVDRLNHEADSIIRIKSPFVVKLYEYQVTRTSDLSISYMLEEFIEGEELQKVFDRGVRFSSMQTVDFLDKMLQGLEACWEQDIVHRDIKPANIMLRRDGSPVIVDFGMARQLDITSETATNSLLVKGTKVFAPPEILHYSKREIDSKTDLFSLGVTAYMMITGQHPFIGDLRNPPQDWEYRLFNAKAVSPSQIDSTIPDALSRYILRLIDRNRSERPQNASHARRILGSLSL